VELAHGPVLDDNFPQNGMMPIFIVTVTYQIFLVSCFLCQPAISNSKK
jgi:hypothetical protein